MEHTPTVTEINCTTGETIHRPYTAEELAQLEIDNAASEARRIAEEAETARVAALKDSARAKLIAGEPLTEDEAATIIL